MFGRKETKRPEPPAVKGSFSARLNIHLSVWFYIAVIFLITAGSALAATYYVSPSGNDGNIGTAAAPFQTIQKAANIVNPGDTVVVRDGVYTDTDNDGYVALLRRAGTSSQWITFRSENEWGAVLDGQDKANFGIWLTMYSQYVRVEGFEIKRARAGGVTSDAANVHFYRNKIHDMGRRQIPCSDPVVWYGIVGIFSRDIAKNIVVDSNIFYNIGRLPGGCADADYNHDHGLYFQSSYVKVTNNVFYNNTSGWDIALSGDANNPTGCLYWEIVNNTFYGSMNSNDPLRSGQIILGWVTDYVTIQNNVSHTPGAYFIDNRYAKYSGPVTVKNNIVHGGAIATYTDGPKYTFSGNIVGSDPRFMDLTNHNFRLRPDSPAIKKGAQYTDRTYDADGKPVANPPDIGAYEYVAATADTTPPSVPANVTATAVSSSQINLSWSASTDNVGVAGYRVYQNGSQIATVSGLSYSDTGLSPTTTYAYRVSAYDQAGNTSAQSTAASATTPAPADTQSPSVPSNVTASAVSPAQINVSWSASTDNVGVAGYKVYRNGSLVATTVQAYYSDTGLSPTTTYAYRVSAYDQAGNTSAQSTAASATTPAPADTQTPTVPANVTATAVSTSQINVTWEASTDNVGVSGYRVYRNGSQVATVTGTNYSDAGLSPSTTYTYRVAAFDAAGNASAQSTAVSATTQAAPDTQAPTVPSNVTATAVSSSQINVSWSASTDNVGVAGYRVYRNGSHVATLTGTNYSDAGLTPSTTYTYRVASFDSAGNASALSSQVSASTWENVPSLYLSDLPWTAAVNGWGPVEKDRSNGEQAAGDGKLITLNGVVYGKGLGVHAYSEVQYNLRGQCSTFLSDIGVDDEVGSNGSVIFQVYGDGVKLYDSGLMTGTSATNQLNVDIGGKSTLQLVVTDGGNGKGADHADWANARIICNGDADFVSPEVPSNLSASAVSSTQILLSWDKSSDNIGIAGYRVYRDGNVIADVPSNSYQDTGLLPETTYSYTVSAYDKAGNLSAQPLAVSATTLAATEITALNLVTPNGGEIIPTGSAYRISWHSPAGTVLFDLKYSLDGGKTWRVIANGITGNNHDWKVPMVTKNKNGCLVKVIGRDAANKPVATDVSDTGFGLAVVRITSPGTASSSQSAAPGKPASTLNIEWDTYVTRNAVEAVLLKYSKNGGRSWDKIGTVIGNPGTYQWTLPSIKKSSDKCLVKVVLKDIRGKTVGVDVSDEYFSLSF